MTALTTFITKMEMRSCISFKCIGLGIVLMTVFYMIPKYVATLNGNYYNAVNMAIKSEDREMIHKTSVHGNIFNKPATTIKPKDGMKQHRHAKDLTDSVRRAHRQSLIEKINTLMKNPPLQWKDFLTHTIMPLQKSAPCFCPPCDEIDKPKEPCVEERSHGVNNLLNVTNSADRLNLKHPFQNIPSASKIVGGAWKPTNCQSKQKVAIIIPFRDRWRQVNTLLQILHPFLQRKNICYRVFVVEQHGDETFNKGRLNNAGFLEVAKRFRFDCVIYQDTDFIPLSDRNFYQCPGNQPMHLVNGLNITNYKQQYPIYVGGVLAFSKEQFIRVNGFTNLCWGWGMEDDDISIRMSNGAKIGFKRPKQDEGLFRKQPHIRQLRLKIQDVRFPVLFATATRRYLYDGLGNVKYKVIKERSENAYTHIMIDIGNDYDAAVFVAGAKAHCDICHQHP